MSNNCLQKKRNKKEKDNNDVTTMAHHVQHVLRLHDLVKLDDVGMLQLLHDLDLAVDLLQVRRVQLTLVNYLNGHLHTPRQTERGTSE